MAEEFQTPTQAAPPPEQAPNKKSKMGMWILVGIVVTIVVVAAMIFLQPGGSSEPAISTDGNLVRYTDDGYAPSNILISVGDTVTWMNDSSDTMTVHSNPHPIHTSFSDLNLGEVTPGDTTTLEFTEAGTFDFHNHLRASHQGIVTVE